MTEHGRWIVSGAAEDQKLEDLLEVKRRTLETIGKTALQPPSGKKRKPALTTNEIQPGKPVDNKPKE
jgi:hypothetical protein